MPEIEQTKEQLERRRGEIIAELAKLRGALPGRLDEAPEEQAIEVEHEEVAVAREANLRRELAAIEDRLLDAG